MQLISKKEVPSLGTFDGVCHLCTHYICLEAEGSKKDGLERVRDGIDLKLNPLISIPSLYRWGKCQHLE